MERKRSTMVLALVAVMAAATPTRAQNPPTPYATMAPVDEYLMPNRTDEIALARSAAPPSISNHAEVMVLGRHGYEVAVPGTNGFVCTVERSWNSPIGAPEFWNPKLRGPDCLNQAAAKSYLPIVLMRARLALAGDSEAQIDKAMQAAFNQKKLPPLEPGAMSYMLSKQGYLNDRALNWHPHLMFFVPIAMSKTWGANLPGSPLLASDDVSDHLTIFMIPVARWSDGTADSRARN